MRGPNRWHIRGFITAAVAAGLAGSLAAASPQSRSKEATQPPSTPAGAQGPLAVGRDAYVYGYPMMLLDQTKQAMRELTNRFAYMPAPPPPADKAVIRPNVDTLYATTFLDLSAEPVVIHVPDTHGRYYVMQMLDANTNVFASVGKRTTGTDARDFVVIGPGWHQTVQLTAGMTAIHAPTNMAWVINRTQVNGDEDIDAVNAIQEELAIAPLSQWPKGAIKAAAMKSGESAPDKTPPVVVASMDAPTYFNTMAILLRDNPPPAAEAGVLKGFATIGLIGGQAFNPSPNLGLTLERARRQALASIKEKTATLGENVNGWRMVLKGVGTYGTDYLQRAAVADYGLGANLAEDAVYPSAIVDASGRPLEGDKPCVLHFDKGQLPPVNAFWSLTMYDKDGYFVANPLQRYAARDSQLEKSPDGGVDIYLQPDSPGKEREQNWLPAPKDAPFTLLLRMYWPKEPVLKGAYRPPGVVQAASSR